MKPVFIPVIVLILISCTLIAGCSSGSGTAPATTIETTAPATVVTTAPETTATAAQTAAASESIQYLPPAQDIKLALTKDRPTSELHLLFQGGPGEKVTTKITMWVYADDGTYTEYVMSSGKKPIPGDEIVAKGTRGGDRCVVFVTSAGTVYRVIDEKIFAMT